MLNKKLLTFLASLMLVQMASATAYTHYLLAYFTGNAVSQEQIRYATSTDGTSFTALNGENPIIASSEISNAGGVRDPFIVRGHNDGYFYMCVTDMKSSLGWASNRGLTILRSKDLINWEHKIFHFPTLFPTEWSDVTRVWAPEIIWDEAAQKFLIYYSLLSNSLSCDKLYYSYITFDENPDNWTITTPKDLFCYKESGEEKATIDANIVQKDGLYYMFFKTEDSEKRIRLHHSTSLTDWSNASEAIIAQNPGEAEEGACCFPLLDGTTWIFMSDLYGRSTATFRQRTTTDFVNFTSIGNLSGVSPRHGSVIWLTDEETERLDIWSDLQQLVDQNADVASESQVYKNAVAAIKTGSTSEMKTATDELQNYLDTANLNSVLRNPNFDNGTTNWTFTGNAVAGGDSRNPCVEAFNCDFNFYQTLTGLKNGYYKLSVQAFQRPRSNSGGWADYANDNKDVTTWIYMNDEEKAVKNVFDEAATEKYTWGTPYTTAANTYTPDNMASASEAFSRGLYENTMGVKVTDGKLTVGIKSTGGTSSSRWSIWDNFRLEMTDTLYVEPEKKAEDETPVEVEPDTCTMNIDASVRGAEIENTHYGIFYEEINHAGDGGLYAELIRNRSFDEGTDYWHPTSTNTISTLSTNLMNSAQTAYLDINSTMSGQGIYNDGFWGMNIVKGQKYHLSFFVRRDVSRSAVFTGTLQDASGNALGKTTASATIGSTWTKVEMNITATGDAPVGRFALTSNIIGEWQVDVVSLFPPTYKDRANGCRVDLAEKLADLKPSFIRFPGGCYVEGQGTLEEQNRFEWKKTIGPIEERPGHLNNNWGYRVSDGMGYQEFLNLCEDLNAEPLFVCNIGLGHGYSTGYTEEDLADLVQETLDAIEFANGDTTTTYGHLRKIYGHPEPYNMRMIEIGNENNQDYGSVNTDYYRRYDIFRKAIKAKYPDMYLIGNVAAWSTDNPLWYWTSPVESVDEHYYRSPDWFASMYHHYDNYSRDHKVYCGEYAVTSDFGNTGTLKAGLGEAVFMLGMEKNSDVVNMASYAPIFVNENNQAWQPDMIRFNSSESFGTPSYYVQQMFPNHVGKQNISFSLSDKSVSVKGHKVGFATWSTGATYSDPSWKDANNKELDFGNWVANSGTWTSEGSTFTQTNTSYQGAMLVNTSGSTADGYKLDITAKKNSGAEGFLIILDYQDENNYIWWNLGGWNNTQQAIEHCVDGTKTTIASASNTIETGREYDIHVEYFNGDIYCYLDGELALTAQTGATVFANCNIDDANGVMYAKVVNYSGTPKFITMNVKGAKVKNADATVLTASNNYAENTMSYKNKVVPAETSVTIANEGLVTYLAPAYSLTAIDFDVTDIKGSSSIEPTSVANLNATDAIYGIDGQRRKSLQRGINIVARRDANGRMIIRKITQ